jgi:hypothetical protein
MQVDAKRTPHGQQKPSAPPGEKTAKAVESGRSHDRLTIRAHTAHGSQHPDEGKRSVVDAIAHRGHVPHGTIHAVESLEKGGIVLQRNLRLLSAGAESHHAKPHQGIWGRLEDAYAVTRRRVWKNIQGTPGLGGIAQRPVPRAMARTSQAFEQSQVGTLWHRTTRQMGGRIPTVGSALGVAIAVSDARRAHALLKDPHSSRKDRILAVSQGGLSIASGVAGALALGAAAGLGIPVNVHALLTAAALTGLGAFVLSFMQPNKSH